MMKLQPSHVVLQKGPDEKTVVGAVFYFPKKTEQGEPVVSPDEKSIEFSCKLGSSTLKVSFDPQKMADQNGTDL